MEAMTLEMEEGTLNGGTVTTSNKVVPSIFRVPANIRDRNGKAYTPSVVSIGPYHHGQPHLKKMKEHKDRALSSFLMGGSFQAAYNELRKLLPELRESYQQLDNRWDNDDNFLRLMISDGAFLINYMRDYPNGLEAELSDPSIIQDILMIENQLPLQVLEMLLAVKTGGGMKETVDELVFNLLHRYVVDIPPMESRLHMLDIARTAITRDILPRCGKERNCETKVRCASDLSDSGLVFRNTEVRGSDGIRLKDGILYLPEFCFDEHAEPLFLNCVAFELLRPTSGHRVSSYIAFMSGLIRSAKDVSLLRSHNLIDSKNIGGDDVVAKLMSTISEGVLFDPYSDLCHVRDSLNNYYYTKCVWRQIRRLKHYIHNAWTMLKQIYLCNPWKAISVVAAVYLLVLTTIQTIYAVRGDHKGNG